MVIDPKEVSVKQLHAYLLGAVVPRPIAFASTIDLSGKVNLSPFSYFNVFSANPPILIFSPASRARNNTQKHSLENVLEVPEVTINMVNYDMVEQMSLASTEYDKGVNEFIKSGLTEAVSTCVKPPYVKEAPIAFECKVVEVNSLGDEGGAGNLVICEVLLIRVNDDILDDSEKIDPFKLDAVARMGGNYYARVQHDAIFEIPKPLATKGIGVDQLPREVRESKILTGNNLGRLANVEKLPSKGGVEGFSKINSLTQLSLEERHKAAQNLLSESKVEEAWLLLLIGVEEW
ncbi:MAG: flavin reductase family protein [Bacteroidota bacterium]